LEEYAEAIRHCQEAIKINSFSAKAYYVKSQAYSKQKEWDSALTEMKACIMLQPKDKKLRVEYENI
jgi:tetratricopeptide (TPR) repeat protein